MPRKDGLVRVQIWVTDKTHAEMSTLIPWGIRRNVHETVLQLVLDAIRSHGMVVAGAILDGKYKLVMVEHENVPNWDGGGGREQVR